MHINLACKLSALFLCLIITTCVKAQNEADTLSREERNMLLPQKRSYFKLSADYLSNAVYYGRKDSSSLPYLTPSITYHYKSGVYLEGSLSYLAKANEGQVDAALIAAGYNFSNKSERFYGDVYAAKYFTNSSSYSVKAEVNAALATDLSYDFGPVSFNGGADVFFSSKTDMHVNAGLSHSFNFGKNDSWSITPGALMNAGTQNFYDDYITNRKYSLKRRKRAVVINTANVVVEKKDFSVLDYELALPVYYDAPTWGLSFSANYSIPVNPVKISVNKGITYRTEDLTNSFYAEAGVYVKLKSHSR